jgi:hypothetical protein
VSVSRERNTLYKSLSGASSCRRTGIHFPEHALTIEHFAQRRYPPSGIVRARISDCAAISRDALVKPTRTSPLPRSMQEVRFASPADHAAFTRLPGHGRRRRATGPARDIGETRLRNEPQCKSGVGRSFADWRVGQSAASFRRPTILHYASWSSRDRGWSGYPSIAGPVARFCCFSAPLPRRCDHALAARPSG